MSNPLKPSTRAGSASGKAGPAIIAAHRGFGCLCRRLCLAPAPTIFILTLFSAFPALAAGQPDLTAADIVAAPCPATGSSEPLAASRAADADGYTADYEALMEWAFSADSVPVPDGGITWQRDTASWTLDYGTLRYMRPMSDGMVTGLVFEGRGRFTMTIPDPVEVRQLPRFTGGPASETLELTFTQMVLRTSEGLIRDTFPAPAGSVIYGKHTLARSRHRWWLQHARFDADARVTAGRLIPGDEYLAVDMNTVEHGWLFYEFDGQRMEEIRLCRMRESFDFVEVWVSLDREAHRREDGRPGSTKVDLVDLVHADLEVDLMEHGGRAGFEIARKNWVKRYPLTRFRATLEFKSLVDGLRAVPLRLHPYAKITKIEDAEGRSVDYLRAPLGKRFPLIHRHENDTSLVLILAEPLDVGEQARVTISYERHTSNCAGGHFVGPVYIAPYMPYLAGGGQDEYPPFSYLDGRYWYPEPIEGHNDRHTVRLTIIHPKKLQARASGRHIEGRRKGKQWIDVWQTDSQVRSAGFSYGCGFEERRILRDGLPEVIAFGPNRLQQIGDVVGAVAANMADSIQFYQDIFGFHLPKETITGTRVDSGSRWYPGFITYSKKTFDMQQAWQSELDIARQTAWMIWGGQVDWESYRDQWLADALAGYSAMMYLEAVTGEWGLRKKGPIKDYEEYLYLRQREFSFATSYRNFQLGPLDVGFRDIVPELMLGMPSRGSFSFSSRSTLAEPLPRPTKGMLDNSIKGKMVLHMLRSILKVQGAGDRDLFTTIVGDFLNTHAGGAASTRDFIDTVEKHTGSDWDWFFDQWVYGTEIPDYTWKHTITRSPGDNGRYNLEIIVNQTGVSSDFRMLITFLVEYTDGNSSLLILDMDRPEKTFNMELSRKPEKVTFNPDHAVLVRKGASSPGGA